MWQITSIVSRLWFEYILVVFLAWMSVQQECFDKYFAQRMENTHTHNFIEKIYRVTKHRERKVY